MNAMQILPPKNYASHGTGSFSRQDFSEIGDNVVFEAGVLVFHPENIRLGNNIYIGHNTFLKGYYKNHMVIGDHCWIGQGCFLHSAGGITIGKAVGIGPMVKIITSQHRDEALDLPVLFQNVEFSPVSIGDGADLGTGSIILPGVTIGRGAIIGAGSVVTKDIPEFSVAAGVPARILRRRG